MAIITFERVEQKYLIDERQKGILVNLLRQHMELDPYCQNEATYRIRNIYLDCPDDHLIRTSLLKPDYKEKLRLRKYDGGQGIYIEIKKKYAGVVSKRRVAISEAEWREWSLEGKKPQREDYLGKQIVAEIDYLLHRYQIEEAVYIAYDRLGFFAKDDPELRVTFDANPRYRKDDLGWHDEKTLPLLPQGQYILEIKDSANLPLWLLEGLKEAGVLKSSFSKYGAQHMIQVQERKKEYAQ